MFKGLARLESKPVRKLTGKNTGIFRERVQNLRISRQIRKKPKNNSGLTAE
jgi:hypothetical protein